MRARVRKEWKLENLWGFRFVSFRFMQVQGNVRHFSTALFNSLKR